MSLESKIAEIKDGLLASKYVDSCWSENNLWLLINYLESTLVCNGPKTAIKETQDQEEKAS